jgi:hypothetical protein
MPRCSPRGSRCFRSPEIRAAISATQAQAKTRSSPLSPETSSGGSGGAENVAPATSLRRASTSCQRPFSKSSFSRSTLSSSTITGSRRISSKSSSIALSRTRLGGPAAMKAETKTFVSQATRRAGVTGAVHRPDLRCLLVRFRGPRHACGHIPVAQSTGLPAPVVAALHAPLRSLSCRCLRPGSQGLQRDHRAQIRRGVGSYEIIILHES